MCKHASNDYHLPLWYIIAGDLQEEALQLPQRPQNLSHLSRTFEMLLARGQGYLGTPVRAKC
jgi:hypothetical protein